MASQNPINSMNGDSSGLSAAQKLMQKHADEALQVAIEEVPDEEDLKHNEVPKSANILEPTDGEGTLAQPLSAKAAGKQKVRELPSQANRPAIDTQSHELFPELGGTPKSQNSPTVASIWSAKKAVTVSPTRSNGKSNGITPTNGSSRASTPTSGAVTPTSMKNSTTINGPPNMMTIPGRHTERISLAPSQLLPRVQMKKPLADILKDINKKSKANITTTTGQGGALWFTAIGPIDACRQALKDLVEQIGTKQSIKVTIPRSTRAHIIGKQGSIIKALQEKSGARIQMPKMEELARDEDDDTVIDVIVEGNALSAEMARVDILKIVDEKTSTINHKIRGIPAEFYPFIAGPRNERVQVLQEGRNVQINIPIHHTWVRQPLPLVTVPGQPPNFFPAPPDYPITLSGDRLAVQEIRAEIERHAQELRRQLTLEQFAINRGRHQFIVGERGIPIHDFLAETGPLDQVQAGVEKAMDLASSMHSTNIDISRQHRNAPGGPAAHARNLTRYLQKRKEIERLERLYNAHIVTPTLPEGPAPWELYSRDGKNAIRAQSEITSIVNGHPPSRMANIDVDPFFHQHLQRDIFPRVHKDYGVYAIIPSESESNAPVLLVFEGPSGLEPVYQVPRTQPTPSEVQQFQQALEGARKYILEIVGRQEAIKTQSVDVHEKFHRKLERFIKNEQQDRAADQIPVRVFPHKTKITLRGPSSAVDLLASKVDAFIAQEIEDEKERGFTMSFDFPQKHANQLIGKGGDSIKVLREKFDVDIQVDNGKVELKGPKAKAEAAKIHITALGKQWADETTHTLKIEPKYHRELIGHGGDQIHKLQDRYKVQIHFPRSARSGKDDQSVADGSSEAGAKGSRRIQAEDEVVVRGPSKGADGARDEILSLLQYFKDTSHSATVTVQQSQIPSLIGQRGKGIDELRQLTGAKIDVPGSRDVKDPSGQVEIQIKGTKDQVAEAKKLLEKKKQIFDQSVSKTLKVDKKHHKALIGVGGSTLRDIIVKAGGSDDRRELAHTVQFPRSEADENIIKIEGNKDVVEKIIATMQAIVAERESQVVEIIEVPTGKHRSLIGRGGETKRDLETRFNVSIDIPRQGNGQTGVKIIGQPMDVAKAKDHILGLVKGEEGQTVQVPMNLHYAISDNEQFFRKMRKDHQVTVDHAGHKLPPKSAVPSNTGANDGTLPLITDMEASADAPSWHVVSLLDSNVDGEIPWVLRGSPENVAKAKENLAAALQQAQKMTNAGYLVLPDPRTYRYVIGPGGSKVNSIRKQTGCKINVPRDQARDEAIEICGSAEGVEKAKELILQAVKEGISNGSNGSRA